MTIGVVSSSWKAFAPVGSEWTLRSFDEHRPPPWEKYWADQREYWGADNPDKQRVQLYFGADDTEANLLRKSRAGYADFCAYLKKWHGLCEVGDKIEVVPIQRNVLVLSTDWKGEVSDHSDLEVWLNRRLFQMARTKRFFAEIYSFGTIVVPRGSIEHQMGERPGKSRVSHRQGSNPDKEESVVYSAPSSEIQIGDAVFSIIR